MASPLGGRGSKVEALLWRGLSPPAARTTYVELEDPIEADPPTEPDEGDAPDQPNESESSDGFALTDASRDAVGDADGDAGIAKPRGRSDNSDGPPKYLSPSSAGLFQECPRRWKHRYIDRLPDPPGEPALAGTFAHRVLEVLLQELPENRTKERAKEIARDVWPEIADDEDFGALALTEDSARAFRWRSWLAIEGLWSIEDPSQVVVEATEQDIRVEIGGVPFRGIVDRVDVESDGLVIADYKSGRAPTSRFEEGRLAQVLMYAAAIAELSGIRPVRARLLYLDQRIVEVDVTDENLAAVTATLQDTWSRLLKAFESGEFETCTGPLCAWCPFLEHCPDGQAEVEERARAGRVRHDAPGLALITRAS